MNSFSGVIAPPVTTITDTLTVSRSDRWLIYTRLQELEISCWCLDDGSLQVEITSPLTVLLLGSVLQQMTRTRQELVYWLEYCWQLKT